MSSIDERIVILTFDNKQFEQGVKTSTESLEQLKRGLDLENSAKGLNALSASAKSFSLGGIESAIDGIKDRFSTMGIIGMTVLKELTESAIELGKKLILAVPSQIVSGGKQRALNFEQANFTLEGLLGKLENGSEKIEEIMQAANNAVTGTAYGLDEAAKAASMLVASGVQDGDKMEFMLKGIAGAAAMTNSSFSDIADIFTTVASNGKLMTQQIRQFSFRGLNVSATLAKELGVAESEIAELVRDGEISFEMFAEAMSNAFGEQAQKANKTFTGSLSNVKAALSRLGAKVAMPSLEHLRDILNVVRPVIDTISKNLDPLIEKLNFGLGKAADVAVGALTRFYLILGGDADKLREQTEYVSDNAKEVIENSIKAHESLHKVNSSTVENFRKILTNFADGFKAIGNNIVGIGKSIGNAFKLVFKGDFSGAVLKLSESFKDFHEKLKLSDGALNGIQTVFTILFNIIKGGLKIIGKLISGYQLLITILGQAVGSLFEYIGAISDAAKESERFQAFVEAISGAIEKIKDGIVAFKDKIVEVFKEIGQSEGVQNLKLALESLWEVIKTYAGSIIDKIIEKLEQFSGISFKFDWVDSFVGFISKAAQGIADFINACLEGRNPIKEFFSSLNEDGKPLNKFLDFLTTLKDKITDFLKKFKIGLPDDKNLFETIGDYFLNGFKKFKDSKAIETLVDFFKYIYEKLKSVDWRRIVSIAYDIAKVVLAFKYVLSLVKLNNSISGFLDGITESFKDLTSIGEDLVKRDFSQKMRDFGLGIAALAGALFLITKIPKEQLKTSLATLGVIMGGFLVVYFAVEKLGNGKAMGRFTLSVLGLSIALNIMVGALKLLSLMDDASFKKGATSLLEILAILAIATRIAGRSSFGTLMGMALAIDMLVPALAILGHMKWSTINKGVEAIFKIAMTLGIASRIAGKSSFGTLVGMALAVDLMVIGLKSLGKMDPKELAQGSDAIYKTILVLAAATAIAGLNKGGAKDIVAMILPIAAAGIAIYAIGKMDFMSVNTAVKALSLTLLSTAAAIKIADSIKKAGGTIALLGTMIVLAGVFKILSDIPAENTMGIAKALSLTALALSGALWIISKIDSKNALKALLPMAGIMLTLGLTFTLLKELNPTATKIIADSLSETMLALSASLWIISKVPFAPAMKGLGAFEIFIVALTGTLAILGGINEATNGAFEELISNGAGVFGKLGSGIGQFIGGILGGVGEGITNSLPGIAENLASFAKNMEPFFKSIDGITPEATASVNNLTAAALNLCKTDFLDGILTFFGGGGTSLAAFGAELESFAPHIVAYSNAISGNINASAIEASANAALILTEVANNIPNEGGKLAEWLGDNTLSMFAEHLVPFGEAMVEYSSIVDGQINETAIGASTNAGLMLTEVANSIPNEGGKLAELLGDNTLSMFAEHLVPFGKAMVEYSSIVDGQINETAVGASANAGLMMTGLAESVPNEGGKLAEWLGDNTLSMFAEHLVPFGEAIVKYGDAVSELNTEAVEKSVAAGEILTKMASSVPNEGGALAVLIGDNTLSRFGEELKAFGPSIVKYSNDVSGLNLGAVITSGAAGTILTNMYDTVKHIVNGGIIGFIEGNPLKKFGEELSAFGEPIATYSKEVQSVSPEAVTASASAADILVTFYDKLKDVVTAGFFGLFKGKPLVKFGEELADFGPYLADYSDSISGVLTGKLQNVSGSLPELVTVMKKVNDTPYKNLDNVGKGIKTFGDYLSQYSGYIADVSTTKISDVVTVVYELIDMAKALEVVNTDQMKNFGNALKEVGDAGIEAFIQSFYDATDRAISAGNSLVEAVGYNLNYSGLYNDFYNAGQYGGEGLVDGLNSYYNTVYSTAWNLGIAAYDAVNSALSIMSPSRKMTESGSYAGEGFDNGLSVWIDKVYGTAYNMGENILEAVSSPLDRINDLLNSEIDLDPIITPVLDLTSIDSGINSLGAMMSGRNLPVGLTSLGLTNTQALNDLAFKMGSIHLNDNSDVVGAIHEMRSEIHSLGESISRMKVQLDGRALVGEIVEPMDQALGIRAEQIARGVI